MIYSPDGLDNPDSIETLEELARVLCQLRLLRIDRMSYEKMASYAKNRISRAEIGRIFKGTDFPSRTQLHLILDILNFSDHGRDSWDRMWSRLAQERFSGDFASVVGQDNKPVTPPSSSIQRSLQGDTTPISRLQHSLEGDTEGYIRNQQVDQESTEEVARKRAAEIVSEAYDEAAQIVVTARDAARDERESLIREAQSMASNAVKRMIDEQAELAQSTEVKIAGVVNEAEERLRKVITALNDSVDNTHRTSEEFRQLFDNVRTSVIGIHTELAQAKEEAKDLRERYGAQREAEQREDQAKPRRRWTLRTDKAFSADDLKTAPPVIGDAPDDNEPPWLRTHFP